MVPVRSAIALQEIDEDFVHRAVDDHSLLTSFACREVVILLVESERTLEWADALEVIQAVQRGVAEEARPKAILPRGKSKSGGVFAPVALNEQ
jgi:hypothetical protein